MPLRFLRPGITTSKRFNRCEWDEQCLWQRLLTLVDDYGRYEADPELIRSHAFPYGDPEGRAIPVTTIVRMMRALADAELVSLYEIAGKEYLQLTRWQERARSASKHPEPPCGQLLAIVDSCSPPSPSPSPSPSPPLLNGAVLGFEEFWSDYPRKVSKPPALRAWRRVRDTDKPKVMQGLAAWKTSDQWNRDGGQYIPYPATFLNQRRWEDVPPSRNRSSRLSAQRAQLLKQA